MICEDRRKQKRDVAFATAFLGISLAMLGWYLWESFGEGSEDGLTQKEFRLLIGRDRRNFIAPTPSRFLSGTFQRSLEHGSGDLFPLRSRWLPMYASLARSMHASFLRILPRQWAPVSPVGGRDIVRDDQRLYDVPALYQESRLELLEQRAAYYNGHAERHSDVRFVVVPVIHVGNWLALSPKHFQSIAPGLAGDRYAKEFRTLLDPRINYAYAGEGMTAAEVTALHYRTDHHFTMRGSHALYRQLHRMLEVEERSPVREPVRWFTVPKVAFRGSLARRAIGCVDPVDVLEDAEFELPEMHLTVGDEPVTRSRRERYESGKPPQGRFTNHYGAYYGNDRGLLHYRCPSAPERNLLVISDSYDNSLEPLIASHFQNAFFVDLRHYRRDAGEPFEFDSFVERRDISDVVFVGGERTVLGFRGTKHR